MSYIFQKRHSYLSVLYVKWEENLFVPSFKSQANLLTILSEQGGYEQGI